MCNNYSILECVLPHLTLSKYCTEQWERECIIVSDTGDCKQFLSVPEPAAVELG